jgi:YggT family protein
VLSYLLWWIITIYIWILLARIVLSFVPLLVPGWTPRGFGLVVVETLYTVTDPPLGALRRVLPSVRFGNVALDLSMLVLILGLQVAQSAVILLPF